MEKDRYGTFDAELLVDIGFEIERKEVIIVDEIEQYADLILNNYPQGLNRIDWNENNLVLIKEEAYSEEFWKKVIKKKLSEICKVYNLGNSEFVVLGDNLINKAYKMTFNVFLEIFWSFFSIPQHTYVISDDGSFCINYTFEDELYFGKADFLSTVLQKASKKQ